MYRTATSKTTISEITDQSLTALMPDSVPTVAVPTRKDPMAPTLTVATLMSPLTVDSTLTAQAAMDLGTKLMACTTVKHNDRNTMALASMVVMLLINFSKMTLTITAKALLSQALEGKTIK